MHHIYIFDQKIRTVERDGVRLIILNDVFRAAEIGWQDFCLPRMPFKDFLNYEFNALARDLSVSTYGRFVAMPVDNVELLILRAATGPRPLTPFSILSECCRSVSDFWESQDHTNGNEVRNVYCIHNENDTTSRVLIPET